MKGKPLNLRDFPLDVYWNIKQLAAAQRKSMRQLVIDILTREVKSAKKHGVI